MDLDKTFCASECTNWDCNKRLSYRHIKACEARGRDTATLATEDFKNVCTEYVEPATPLSILEVVESTIKGLGIEEK